MLPHAICPPSRNLLIALPFLLLLGLAPAPAEAGNRRSACGGVGQRGCCAHEILPSCDSGLVEKIGVGPGAGAYCGDVLFVPIYAAGTCYRTSFPSFCGSQNQRACSTTEHHPACKSGLTNVGGTCRNTGGFPADCGSQDQRACTIFEHIPSCRSGLVELIGDDGAVCREIGADGFPTHCGHDGQDACVITEHIPSCVPGTFELGFPNGTCEGLDLFGFPSFCGHDGQGACTADLQLQLGIPSCVPGLFEDGFPDGICRDTDVDGFPERCGDHGEVACDLGLQVQLGIPACKDGLQDAGLCLEPISLTSGGLSWPADEHAPTDFVDGERHVFLLHGMTSSLSSPNEPAKTLLRAGHQVYLVDYASNNRADEPEALTIRKVQWAQGEETEFPVSTAWTSDAEWTGLSLYLPEVADTIAEGIEALVPADEHVALVGHSMGGLVIRLLLDRRYDALRVGGRRITEVVTLGSPHDGSNIGLGSWIPTFVPDEGERDFVFGVIGSLGVGAASCAATSLLLDAAGVFSLFALDGSELWPLVAFQNCQMESFHLAVDLSDETLDDGDFPHIRWGLVAGRLGTEGEDAFEDGAVPIFSALGIAHDESVLVDAAHSPLVDDAATQPFVEGVVGLAADLAARACSNGLDDDNDGLEDAEDPGCVGPDDPSEIAGSRSCGLGGEVTLLLPGLLIVRARRRMRR